jgi:hypothetical protein
MPRKYERKSSQASWESEAMAEAIKAVKEGNMPFQTASKLYNIPRNTLKRRVLDKNKDAKNEIKLLGSIRPVFTSDQEMEIVQHIEEMETRFYGFTKKELRSLAYQLAEKNGLNHNFNKESQLAGEHWLKGFRDRHPNISLRTPEATSAARARAFNKNNVNKFFSLLDECFRRFPYSPHRVFNVDETGLTTVQSKSSKVFAAKGRKQVGSLTSAERGILSTVVICMSAGGIFVPPMIIFPRVRMKEELMDGAPPGTEFACHKSGWMQLEIFTRWFTHFLKYAKPTAEDPCLLILDGHVTHTKNLEFINMARENFVTVLCLPPHCSHKLQPLDVAFMGPLNTFYVQEIEKYLKNNPGRTISQFQVSKLFAGAYLRAGTPTTAINGFRRCGIVPYNPHVFSDADFVASEVADRDEASEQLLENAESVEIVEQVNSIENPLPSTSRQVDQNSLPSTSRQVDQQHMHDLNSEPSTSELVVSPKDIVPIPKCQSRTNKKTRKKGSTAIITDSPYKNDLETAKESNKSSAGKKQLFCGKNTKKTKKTQAPKRMKTAAKEDTSSDDDDQEDSECLYCNSLFSQSKKGEGWVSCSLCKRWAYEECAGCNEDIDIFLCDLCTYT